MPSLGPAEILVILVVGLLVFGPNKMPEIGKQFARAVREFRKIQKHLSSGLEGITSGLNLDAANAPPPTPGAGPPPTLPPKDSPATDAAALANHDGPRSTGETQPPPPADPA
jgi:sec-independent protein translocase protein TatA